MVTIDALPNSNVVNTDDAIAFDDASDATPSTKTKQGRPGQWQISTTKGIDVLNQLPESVKGAVLRIAPGFYPEQAGIELVTNYNIIEVVSQGDASEHELSYYTEPFSQAEKRSSGFGLGIYIVHNILVKLGYRLGYNHSEGKNIFMIIPTRS